MNDLRGSTGDYLIRRFSNRKENWPTASMKIPLIVVVHSKDETVKSLKTTVGLHVYSRISTIFLS